VPGYVGTLVMIEFDSLDAAREWYQSDEYSTTAFFIDGVELER